MRILQICDSYSRAGVKQQVLKSITAAVNEKHEVRIIAFGDQMSDEVIEDGGVKVTLAGTFARVSSQPLSFSFAKLLKETVRRFLPELIIFHYPNPLAASVLLRVLRGYKNAKLIVFWHHDVLDQKFIKKFLRGQNAKLLTRADKIIVTSENYLKSSKPLAEYINKCEIVSPCFLDSRVEITEKIIEKKNGIKALYGEKKICFFNGKHVEQKGVTYLVRASKFLSDGYVIVIGGKGPLTSKLKKIAGSDGKIKFIGKISHEDFIANLIACDVFCLPSISRKEYFSIPLLEAMKLGKPAVTFYLPDTSVNYVSVNGETGIAVENKNSIAFAKAIKKIAQDTDIAAKYSSAAKKRAEENFSFDVFKKNILAVIDKTV